MAAALSNAHAQDVAESPEDLVRAFIRDDFAWNNWAAATIGQARAPGTPERIQQAYRDILDRYCPPGFKGEPLSYGSNPTHDPAQSVIVAVELAEHHATVRTQKPMGFGMKAVHTHEFDLARRDGRWYIVGVFYIDGRQRLPSL